MVGAVAVVLVLLVAGLVLADLLRCRQRIATASDLAALAGAQARVAEQSPCDAARRVTVAHGALLVSCQPFDDESVQVTVAAPWSPRVRWIRGGTLQATSRAGPAAYAP